MVGNILVALGAAIYFRGAWELAARGLRTPAASASTKYLVTTALPRYIRNPMYIGVALAIVGQAVLFRNLQVLQYAAIMLLAAHLFVIFDEEPTRQWQFWESTSSTGVKSQGGSQNSKGDSGTGAADRGRQPSEVRGLRTEIWSTSAGRAAR